MKNNHSIIYRDNGAVGAILDEYERSIKDLKTVIQSVKPSELVTIVDDKTTDDDCRSIQSVLAHMIRSGYAYAIYVRNHNGEKLEFPQRQIFETVEEYAIALDKMFNYNVLLFENYPNQLWEEMDNDKKIKVSWGQLYDVEQLFEHAIVHILRHRRQIERFILKLRQG